MKNHIFAALLMMTGPAFADAPVVENVAMKKLGATWTFDVTLSHKDTGWEDYADGWRIMDKAGNQLGVRPLAHPHVNEQPFTRSLSGVNIPADVKEVVIQASDSVGGWSNTGKTIKLR